MIDVSAIIVTRNTVELTCAAVASLIRSADKSAKEIVVVDNGSTDATSELLPRTFPGVTYLRSDKNLGFAGANNLAAREVTGEFLLLLNSDARVEADAVAVAVDYMREHVDCAVTGAQLLNPDGSRQNSIANSPSLATELLNKSLLRRLFPRRFPGKEQQFTAPLEVESVVGAFMLIRRSAWLALGGLDERFFFFLEETDFCLQARRRGWKVVHLPKARVCHEQGKSAKQVGAGARIEYWRSRYAYFGKNHGLITCTLLGCGLCLRLALSCVTSGLLVLASLGLSPRWRHRWKVNRTLGLWHLLGCPAGMGLPR